MRTRDVDPHQWSAATTPDPLESHRPLAVECSTLTGWYPEGDGLELDTARCNYVDLTQPLGVAAVAETRIVGRVTHFDLVAPEPAVAHVALLLDDTVLWQREVEVPGPANSFDIDAPIGRHACADAMLRLHLHNHGQNTWLVEPLIVTSE